LKEKQRNDSTDQKLNEPKRNKIYNAQSVPNIMMVIVGRKTKEESPKGKNKQNSYHVSATMYVYNCWHHANKNGSYRQLLCMLPAKMELTGKFQK
jgi:hypothetical protein